VTSIDAPRSDPDQQDGSFDAGLAGPTGRPHRSAEADDGTTPDRAATRASSRPADARGTGGMVPPAELLPTGVLPTERLNARAMPKPFLRDELRRIPNVRNVGNVLSTWLQSFGLVAGACWLTPQLALPLALLVWAAVFVLMGRAFALYAILAHEAAHRLLFSRRRGNDMVGRWAIAYPAFVPLELYRRGHFAHHRDEFGPNEPDRNLYDGYPISRASFRRKLTRDAVGISGWKNLKGLVRAFRSETARPVATRIVVAQIGVAVVLVAIGGPSRWWLYPALWLGPWMTVWRVINRLRSIAEHGGMMRSDDRRQTTHVVRQSWPARFWMVPFNTGWHLAHHVDMGVPFQNLPRLHHELVATGWIVPELEHRSYRELWRALASG
jgi:fatty acid desaturase